MILVDGEIFSVHSSSAEASDYHEKVKLVYPNNDVQVEEHKPGLSRGEPVWCGTGLYDFFTDEIGQFERQWLWPDQITNAAPVFAKGKIVSRYLFVSSRETLENDMRREMKRLLQHIELEIPSGKVIKG